MPPAFWNARAINFFSGAMPFLLHGSVRFRTVNQNVVGRFFHRVSLRSRAKRKTPEVRLSQVLRHSLARVVFAHRRAPPRPPHQGKRPANSLIADEITRILSAVGLQSFLGRTLRRTVALSHGMGDGDEGRRSRVSICGQADLQNDFEHDQ